MEQLDLIDGQFQNSNLFKQLPLFDNIYFMGLNDKKVRQYKAIREDQECLVLALSIIRKDEDFFWKAVSDLVKRSVADAATTSHGVYLFDLLTIDIHKEASNFNPAEFSTLILNTTRRLSPGQQRLIKYSSAYAIIQKIIHEDWGKMSMKTSVEVFKDQPEFLDLLVKRILKGFQFPYEPVILLIHDLSNEPIYDLNNDVQQGRLQKVMQSFIPTTIDFPPEVYIQDKNGLRELLSNCIIE